MPLREMTAQDIYQSRIGDILKGSFFPPMNGSLSIEQIVKSEFRSSNAFSSTKRYSAGFSLYRHLASVWKNYLEHTALASSLSSTSSSSSSLRVIKNVSYADSLLPGVFLIANPLMFGALKRAVILLLQHNQAGSCGVAVNKPLPTTLSTAIPNLPQPVPEVFSNYKVFHGGKVQRLNMIHEFPAVGGEQIPMTASTPIFSGGSIEQAALLVQDLASSSSSASGKIHFYVGCSTWHSGRLQEEIDQNFWIPVRAPPDEVIRLTGDSIEGGEETASVRNDVWEVLLTSLGPPFSSLTQLPSTLDLYTVRSIDWEG